MKKFTVLFMIGLFLAGCVSMGEKIHDYKALDEANINGKDIYKGMSPSEVRGLLGKPDKVESMNVIDSLETLTQSTIITWKYGDYALSFQGQTLSGITLFNASRHGIK